MMHHSLEKTKRMCEVVALSFQLNTKKLLKRELSENPWQKFCFGKIKTRFVSDPFFEGTQSHCSKAQSHSVVQLSSDHLFLWGWDIIVFMKDWTLYEDLERGLTYIMPEPSRGRAELRKFNWPSTRIISATLYLYASVKSSLAGCRHSCYAERNVNRAPRGAGMWVWVKTTHADTISEWPDDYFIPDPPGNMSLTLMFISCYFSWSQLISVMIKRFS